MTASRHDEGTPRGGYPRLLALLLGAAMVLLTACGEPEPLRGANSPRATVAPTPKQTVVARPADAPPPIVLRAQRSGREQEGALGSYCWFAPSQIVCADFAGVGLPGEPLVLEPGDGLEIDFSRLGGAITSAGYELYAYDDAVQVMDGEPWIMPPGDDAGTNRPHQGGDLPPGERASLGLALPPGDSVLMVHAKVEGRGSTGQGFYIRVVAPSPAPTPTPIILPTTAAGEMMLPRDAEIATAAAAAAEAYRNVLRLPDQEAKLVRVDLLTLAQARAMNGEPAETGGWPETIPVWRVEMAGALFPIPRCPAPPPDEPLRDCGEGTPAVITFGAVNVSDDGSFQIGRAGAATPALEDGQPIHLPASDALGLTLIATGDQPLIPFPEALRLANPAPSQQMLMADGIARFATDEPGVHLNIPLPKGQSLGQIRDHPMWIIDEWTPSNSTPVPCLVVGGCDRPSHTLYAVDAETGTLLFATPYEPPEG